MVKSCLACLLIVIATFYVVKGFDRPTAVFVSQDRPCFTGNRDQQRRSAELTTLLKSGSVRANPKLACVCFCLMEKYGLIDKRTRNIKRSEIHKMISLITDPSIKSVAASRADQCVSKAYNKDVCLKIAQLVDCFARDGAFKNWNGDLNAIITNLVPPTNAQNSSAVTTVPTSTVLSAAKPLHPTLPFPVPVPAPPTIPRTTTPPSTTPPSTTTPTTTPTTTTPTTTTPTTTTPISTTPSTTTTAPTTTPRVTNPPPPPPTDKEVKPVEQPATEPGQEESTEDKEENDPKDPPNKTVPDSDPKDEESKNEGGGEGGTKEEDQGEKEAS